MKTGIKSTLIVATALFMAACSKESVENGPQQPQQLISFSVPAPQWQQTTRARVLNSMADLQLNTTDIRVKAMYTSDHSTVYFDNQRLSYDGADWVINKYYWIPDVHLDFLAEVVSGNRSDFDDLVTNPTKYTFDYAVPADIAKQHDYVYAVSLDKYREEVPLDFRHALSQIVFTASVAENWNVTIQSITIHNVSSAGTFSYETRQWSGLDAPSNSYTFTLETPKVFNGMSASERLQATDDERLVLMPQALNNPWTPKDENGERVEISTADSQQQSYVEISCRIQDRYDTSTYYVGKDGYEKVYAPISGTWEPNKVYIYDLPFGDGYTNGGDKTIEQIMLSATIADWSTGETESGVARFD